MLQKPSVKIDNIMRTIEEVKQDEFFNMNLWNNCTCGAIYRLKGAERNNDTEGAARFLGVDDKLTRPLLFACDDLHDNSKEAVIAQLYHLAEFGEVVPRPSLRPRHLSEQDFDDLEFEFADDVPSVVG